jgi:branched-chain amino acid aminotransferase
MSAMGGVATFEWRDAALHPLGRHDSLSASSAALPEGAYTTFRTYGGTGVVRLDQHARRLEQSASLKGNPSRVDPTSLRQATSAALRREGHAESRVRLTVAPPRLFLAVEAFTPLPRDRYERGVACATVDVRRSNPHAKDTRFIATAGEAYAHLPEGVEEGLLVAEDGTLLEGLSSNFFAVRDGVLRTEQERVLEGVTRSLVLEAAAPLLPLRRVGVRLDEVPAVSEAFITSVSREVLPVVALDGRPLGDGRVGPATRAVMAAFAALVARERETLS